MTLILSRRNLNSFVNNKLKGLGDINTLLYIVGISVGITCFEPCVFCSSESFCEK